MVDIMKCDYARVRDLTVQQLPGGDLGQERIKRLFEAWQAFWQHSGDPTAPHAVLQSGRHSDTYFNSPMALRKATVAEIVAHQLARKLSGVGSGSWIVGPSFGANSLLYALRAHFGCFGEVTKKQPDKSQQWSDLTIPAGSQVQLVEDVVTTGESVLAAHSGVVRGNADKVDFFPRIGAIVNRSGLEGIQGFNLVSLITITPNTWAPDSCPLCKGGSPPIEKVKQHWAELTLG